MNEYVKLPQDHADDLMAPKRCHCCSGHTPWQERVSEGGAVRRRSQGQGNLEKRQIPFQSSAHGVIPLQVLCWHVHLWGVLRQWAPIF